ncbi:MAG: LPS assembly lipoprotein LptE [Bacteroidaceae bacterium]
MAWNKKVTGLAMSMAMGLMMIGCSISMKFNGASINYDVVKSVGIETFPIKSAYVYAPLGTVFNDELQTIYMTQTRLQVLPRGGDLSLSGEITGYEQLNQSVKADGYSSETQLKVTVNVRFVNNSNHAEDFERQFSSFRNYDSSLLLSTVQDGLISEMVKEIVEQIFNATVANW